MAERSIYLAEHFETLPQQRQAALLGMWTFLATEVLFFGALFLGYTVYRHADPSAFAEAGRHTLLVYGTVNTAILLTSSLTMALALHAIQEGKQRPMVLLLLLTACLGACFLVLKGFEYREDILEDLLPGKHFSAKLPLRAEMFWVFYWAMTGLHAIHVTVGVGLLGVMALLGSRGKYNAGYHTPVEISGLYWHFVDVVWIFLYPLLYLVHRGP